MVIRNSQVAACAPCFSSSDVGLYPAHYQRVSLSRMLLLELFFYVGEELGSLLLVYVKNIGALADEIEITDDVMVKHSYVSACLVCKMDIMAVLRESGQGTAH